MQKAQRMKQEKTKEENNTERLVRSRGAKESEGESQREPMLGHWLSEVWIPTGVFFVVIFFGHHVWPRSHMDWWLDKLCIHQTREKLKEQGVAALPELWLRNAEN